MKKILLALLILSSFVFGEAGAIIGSAPTYIKSGSNYYKKGIPTFTGSKYTYNASPPPPYWLIESSNYDTFYIKEVTNLPPPNGDNLSYKLYNTYSYNRLSTSDCLSPNSIVNGECTAPPAPVCPTGAHNDTSLSGSPCVSNFEQLGKETFPNGNFLVSWADGANTFCDASTSLCSTYDKGMNNRLPNRYLNPEFNPDGSIKYIGALPNETPIKGFTDFILEPIGNAVGKTLQFMGFSLLFAGTGNGALIYDTIGAGVGLNFLNPAVTTGTGLVLLGNSMVTPDNVITTTPSSPDVKVTLVDKTPATKVNNLSSFSPDGIYTQRQITEAGASTIWDNAGGSGKLPPTALVLGSDIIYPINKPSKAIVNTPDAVLFVETKPDNSSIITEIKKQDIANTVNNNADLPVTQKVIQPEKISNDGKITQTQDTFNGLVSPRITATPIGITPPTNSFEGLSKTTGLPEVVDYNPRTGTKDGNLYSTATGLKVGSGAGTGAGASTGAPTKDPSGALTGTTDLSGVTGRLDKISNQLTKLNDAFSQTETPSAVPDVLNPIDNSKTDGLLDTFTTAWGTAKGNVDTLATAISNGKDTVSGGFSLNLSTGYIETCPYTAILDFDNGHTYELPIDFCKIFSPLKPILSIFFNILFQLMIITFSFKSFIRLV